MCDNPQITDEQVSAYKERKKTTYSKMNERKRKQRALNGEIVRAKDREYWAKHREHLNEQKRKRVAKNRAKYNEKKLAFYHAHRDEINAKRRAKYAAKKLQQQAENKDT